MGSRNEALLPTVRLAGWPTRALVETLPKKQDVIVLAVPVISADPATETALALVRRLLALTPETI